MLKLYVGETVAFLTNGAQKTGELRDNIYNGTVSMPDNHLTVIQNNLDIKLWAKGIFVSLCNALKNQLI